MRLLISRCLIAASLPLALAACGDDGDSPSGDPDAAADAGGGDSGLRDDAGVGDDAGSAELAIVGEYDTDFGGFVRVTEEGIFNSWYGDAAIAVTFWDNDAGYLVGQNSSDDAFNPDLWSRVDWVIDGDTIYWCQTAFGAADEQAAIDTPRSDDTDPSTGGCGGAFAWTTLTVGQGPLSVIGNWDDNFGQTHDVSAEQWIVEGTFTYDILEYSNADEFLIAENGEGTGEFEGLFSKYEWTWFEGSFWYCTSAFDAADADAAREATADATNPSEGGCAGLTWSQLIEVEEDVEGEGADT